ncbi:2,5-diamino-6-ribosylamino-4(3H)-pyrimidinone 5'-phosphate reductase [Trichomonascus vanleenenianus]|uniref:2,5-diamino-6-(ribosylamino)-4(3H)-pyrimidinone 5'-phosphate reductase n=1 Tax=Trichomonascus vanleenenianus TaxID=2268995 RepID=UPI003EC96EF5
MTELTPLPQSLVPFLEGYLPKHHAGDRPFVTLTYAASIDSRIAAGKGQRTTISHLETKTMTHYLRSKHDALLVGKGTVLADDPKLNCRYNDHKIRPVVVDQDFVWDPQGSQCAEIVRNNEGLAPWILIRDDLPATESIVSKERYLNSLGGKVIRIPVLGNKDAVSTRGRFIWEDIFRALVNNGIKSVMVEGGAEIINCLLPRNDLVDSLVITIGPVFLGSKGVEVAPPSAIRLTNVSWWTGLCDSILAANISPP